MRPEVIHVPGFSELVAKMGVPLSPVTRGAGLVFVSGTPPIDLETGSIVKVTSRFRQRQPKRRFKHALRLRTPRSRK